MLVSLPRLQTSVKANDLNADLLGEGFFRSPESSTVLSYTDCVTGHGPLTARGLGETLGPLPGRT